MKLEQIKTHCEEARRIAAEEGIAEGLAFVIGEKLSRIILDINKCHNKLKFLYPEKNPFTESPSSPGQKSLGLSYAMTVSSSYGDHLDKLALLETARENFILEIKKVFALQEIQNYLSSYPRLGLKQKSVPNEEAEEKPEFSAENIFSEVEDIFLAETMIKLFNR